MRNPLSIVLLLLISAGVCFAEQFSVASFSAEAVKHYVNERLQLQFSDVPELETRVQIKSPAIFSEMPKETLYIYVDFAKPETFLGKILLDVVYLSEHNQTLQESKLFIESTARASVAVSSRKIKSGTIIRENDLRLKNIELNARAQNLLFNKEDIVGMEAKGTIPANSFITDKKIHRASLVRKGDSVSALIKSDNYEITVDGTALDSGIKGDVIRLKADFSKKIVRGEILNEKSILVRTH